MKPQEVLDMDLGMVQSCISGYSDRLLDQQIIAVQSGYWAAYYMGGKHPKPVPKVVEELVRKHEAKAKDTSAPKPDVDVEAYLEMEAKFQAQLRQQAGELPNG